jgi:hypothetical protein
VTRDGELILVPGNNGVARRGVIKNLSNENISSIIKMCQTVQRNKNNGGKKGKNWVELDRIRSSSRAFFTSFYGRLSCEHLPLPCT